MASLARLKIPSLKRKRRHQLGSASSDEERRLSFASDSLSAPRRAQNEPEKPTLSLQTQAQKEPEKPTLSLQAAADEKHTADQLLAERRACNDIEQSMEDKLTTEDLKKVRGMLYQARSKWYDIGVELGMEPHNLDAIKSEYRAKPEDCLTHMLKDYLKGINPKPTWDALTQALKAEPVSEGQIAKEIEKEYKHASQTSDFYALSTDSGLTSPLSTSEEEVFVSQQNNQSSVDIKRETFQCLCNKCSLSKCIAEGCPKYDKQKKQFPYLNTEDLSEDAKENLEAQLISEVELMEESFLNLFNSIADSLIKCRMEPSTVARYVFSAGRCKSGKMLKPFSESDEEKLQKATSIDEIFNILLPYISFFNYEALEYVIQKLGAETDIQNLNSYLATFDIFCQRRVFEVPPDVYCNVLGSNKDIKKYIVKIKGDIQDKTLGDAKAAQRKIAHILGVEPAMLLLRSVHDGCVRMEFSLPKQIYNEIIPLNSRQVQDLKKEGVVEVPLDEILVSTDHRSADIHNSDLPTVLTSSEPEKTSSLLSKQRLLEDKKVSQSRGSHCDVIQSNFSMKKSYTTLLKKKKCQSAILSTILALVLVIVTVAVPVAIVRSQSEQTASCLTNHQVRLQLPSSESCNPDYVIGTVQLCEDGVWKNTVCDHQWTLQDAMVVCRELEFNVEGAASLILNETSVDLVSSLVPVCSGSETHLSNCTLIEPRAFSTCAAASVACPLDISIPAFNLSQCNSPFQIPLPITDPPTTEPHSTDTITEHGPSTTSFATNSIPSTTSSDTDECMEEPPPCDTHADCYNTDGSFYCVCKTGFLSILNNTQCEDIDECEVKICSDLATCNNTIGSFYCICPSGFTVNGTECEDINECDEDPRPCPKHEICVNTNGGFGCSVNNQVVALSVTFTVGPLILVVTAIILGVCYIRKISNSKKGHKPKFDAASVKSDEHFEVLVKDEEDDDDWMYTMTITWQEKEDKSVMD